MAKKTIAIIGGGAAGMIAALSACGQDNKILLFERQPRVGKKLLATGNGRCNITNINASSEHYHGAQADFVDTVLSRFTVDDTLAFFAALGLLCKTEDKGKVYPYSNQAGSVLDVLRFALDRSGITVYYESEVRGIKKKGEHFDIITDAGKFAADKVIVTTGGAAADKLGGTPSGYALLQSFGHKCTAILPSLVQVKTDNTYTKALKGIKIDATATLTADGKKLQRTEGEVLFTEYGLSGPAIFDLSRLVALNNKKAKLCIKLDLMPEYDAAQINSLLQARLNNNPNIELENYMTGFLNKRLGQIVLKYCGFAPLSLPANKLKAADLAKIAAAIKSFAIDVHGTLGLPNAQVTVGGIVTDGFSPYTMESNIVSGLYAAGEVLDVDGDCGGYNLQWAWSSGRLAGMSAGGNSND